MEPKAKLMSVVLIFIILILGFFTMSFWRENETLKGKTQQLQRELKDKATENQALTAKLGDAKRSLDKLTSEKEAANKELTRIGTERDKLQTSLDTAMKEKEKLTQALKKAQSDKGKEATVVVMPSGEESTGVRITATGEQTEAAAGTPKDDLYWEKVVKEKALLKAKTEDLQASLKEKELQAKALDKDKRDLKSRLDDLLATREELARELEFNKRTIDILSADLVKEKEDKRLALKEVKRLRNENSSLNRELRMIAKGKQTLEDKLSGLENMKGDLESKMLEVQTMLRERSLEIGDMQEKLVGALDKAKGAPGSVVELPPIVVKKPRGSGASVAEAPSGADASMSAGAAVHGTVIAVNRKENFVVVDIGETSGLQDDQRLVVSRGNKRVASLKVIEIRKEIAACDIQNIQPGESIREGDIVVSE